MIVDREGDLSEWVSLLKKVQERRIMILAFANNHYAGFGPGTVDLSAGFGAWTHRVRFVLHSERHNNIHSSSRKLARMRQRDHFWGAACLARGVPLAIAADDGALYFPQTAINGFRLC